MQQDAMQIKEKIISILRLGGPSLPVHISKGTGLSILFASAFLSELFYEKKILISHIKVGNSPLYLLPGQEPQLERFSSYLKSKEKDAFTLLKESKFLKDSELEPAIRVALREIKDFAIAFKRNDEIYWRYFTIPEEEFGKKEELTIREAEPKPLVEIVEEPINEIQEEGKLDIFEEEETEEEPETEAETEIEEEPETEEEPDEPEIPKKDKKKPVKKKTNQRQDENFFNKIKEFLSKRDIDIVDIQSFNKNDLVLKIKENDEEKLLIAYNKKRIMTSDLLKAYKRASESGLKYFILSLGEPSRNLKELVSAIKDLSDIDKIE